MPSNQSWIDFSRDSNRSSIAGPVIFYLVGGQRATEVLDGWKSWLSAHNGAVMAVLFLVFGVVLFSEGLRGLTA